MSTAVVESTQQNTALKVDRETGVIHQVKVCGRRSKNGRLYGEDVLAQARPLYEGATVYLDHGLEPGEERPMRDHFGNLQNARMIDGELFADLHYLTHHSEAEVIAERAERFPRNFGLSHDAEIDWVLEGGLKRVLEITAVHSVDLVTRPATNDGIFEQETTKVKKVKRKYRRVLESLSVKKYPGKFRVLEQMELAGDPMLDTPVEIPVTEEGGEPDATTAIEAAFRSMIVAILDDTKLDVAAKSKKISEMLKQQEKLTDDTPATEDEDDEEVLEQEDDEEITESEDEDEVTESEDDEKKGVKESLSRQNARLRRELARTKKDRVIESVLRKHKIPPNDRLRGLLRQFRSAAEMSDYLDGGELSGASGGVLESNGYAIASAATESFDDYQPAKDPKELISRCRRVF